MNFSSSVWITAIIVGAAIAAIGNIQFNIARDREKGIAASEKALAMLAGESARNLKKLHAMQQLISKNEVTIEGFETAAWNVVSSSGLLVQAETKTLQEITEVYYLVEQSNKYHDQIVEMSIGMASAIGGVENSRKKYMGLLNQTLSELEPKLNTIVNREGKALP